MSNNTASEFRAGVVATLPAAVAVVPFGLLLGTRAVEQGLTVPEVALMSATVFAGSAQFVVIGDRDVVVLKAIHPPEMSQFDKLVGQARKAARRAGMKRSDIKEAVKEVRGS